jgi:hypothetical protein
VGSIERAASPTKDSLALSPLVQGIVVHEIVNFHDLRFPAVTASFLFILCNETSTPWPYIHKERLYGGMGAFDAVKKVVDSSRGAPF